MDMRAIISGHALKSLLNPVEIPNENLGIGEDEKHTNIPILIFTEQHLPTVPPTVVPPNQLSYEEVQKDGTGSSLALEDFETQNFNIGIPLGGV